MFRKVMILAIVLLFIGSANAVPLAPEIVKHLKDTGQLERIVQADRAARERGVWQANPDPIRFGLATDIDTLHCIFVLADFDDMPYTAGSVAATKEDLDSVMFSRDIYEPGSMTDYYFEVSYGQALLIGEITDWYRMPQNSTYYADGQRGFGSYPRNAQRLAEDAVTAADADVDFSNYDNDGDGMVDGLFVVHAGPGYENSGNLNHIHSHAWSTGYQVDTDDGVYIWRYSMEPEEDGGVDIVHIGVFCHEFGHVLGLPDLYDYDYDSDGTGGWSIMSGGVWAGGGRRPVHFDAWCKKELGFINPQTPTTNLNGEQIDAVEYSPDVYRLYSQGDPFLQYFLVENRQRMSFDQLMPGSGLLIYHVDETRDNNDNQDRYLVAVEQADGRFDLEHNNGSDAGDPWPGAYNNNTFDAWSTPNSDFYDYGASEIAVINISDDDSSMTADLHIMYNQPLYQLNWLTIDDSEYGNDNGLPEAGETCDIRFEAVNVRSIAEDLIVTASFSDSEIILTDSISLFGQIPVDQDFNNDYNLVTFEVPADYPTGTVTITLTFEANDGSYVQVFTVPQVIGIPDVMLVDDDGGDTLESYYADALNELDLTFSHWDIASQGLPGEVLNQHPLVIWFTGDSRSDEIPQAVVEKLIDYLSNGGRLLITSQDFVQKLYERGDADDIVLLNSYLKVYYDDREAYHFVNGEDGTAFEGLSFITGGNEGANNQNSQDALFLLDGGQQLMTYAAGTLAAAGVLDDGYSVMTIGFGIEGANSDYPGYDTRADLIEAAYEYLYSTTGIDDRDGSMLPNSTGLVQNYPNPFNARTMISFELQAQSEVSLDIYDLLGRHVETLVEEMMPAGSHSIVWDAGDMSSGMYFYKLTTDDISETKRMLLIK